MGTSPALGKCEKDRGLGAGWGSRGEREAQRHPGSVSAFTLATEEHGDLSGGGAARCCLRLTGP